MSKLKEIKIACLGYNIKADWYEKNSDTILLVLPGYTSKKAKYEELVSYVSEHANVSALVIDYSGHGESPFDLEDLSRADNFREVITAYDWLRNEYPNKKIVVMGTSYGGFHAAYLTKFRTLDSVIFRVPASYPEETLYDIYKTMKDRHSSEYRLNKDNYTDHWLFSEADSVKGRSLLVTHEFDDVCPPKSTVPFAEAFNADHWEAKGFKHGFGESDVTEEQKAEYYQKIVDWLKK